MNKITYYKNNDNDNNEYLYNKIYKEGLKWFLK